MSRSWWWFALGSAAAAIAVATVAIAGGDPRPTGAVDTPADRPVTTPETTAASPLPTTTPPTTISTTTTTSTTSTTTTTLPPAKAVLAGMTLEQKVGQVFMVEVHGVSANAPSAEARRANGQAFGVETAAEVVTKYGVGGVIYFGHNVIEPQQVAGMSAALQQAAEAGPGIGLLIATDQEGGRVNRIGSPATVFPSARVFGDIGSAALTERAAQASATELRAMGINHVLAPVADVATVGSGVIGDRAFGGDPAVVAEQVAAAVRGYGAGGVAATVKHFPGHGGTTADSHVTLPVLTADEAGWEATHLRPFEDAVAAGVPAVMVGHLALPSLDPSGAPATLSAVLVREQLRARLGFEGLVVTDSLSMAGVRSVAADDEIAVGALTTGADLLLMPFDLPTAYDAVLAAARDDPAVAARLDEAVERVLALKHDLGVLDPPPYVPGAVARRVGAPDHQAVLDEVLAVIGGDALPAPAAAGPGAAGNPSWLRFDAGEMRSPPAKGGRSAADT